MPRSKEILIASAGELGVFEGGLSLLLAGVGLQKLRTVGMVIKFCHDLAICL